MQVFHSVMFYEAKALVLWLLFFLPFGAMATEENQPQKELFAYLTLVGPGEGLGKLGHGYIIFSEQLGVLHRGEAYQYNLGFNIDNQAPSKKAEDMNLAEKFFTAIRSPFVVSKMPSGLFMLYYENQHRGQLHYRVLLPSETLYKLRAHLETDAKRRKEELPTDYNIITDNCLSNWLGH